jgi:hypothetical protein
MGAREREQASLGRKTVMASRSFGKLVTARQEMEEAVNRDAVRADFHRPPTRLFRVQTANSQLSGLSQRPPVGL